jgi:hypothetical protein
MNEEEIKGITEENAQELISAFEGFLKTESVWMRTFDSFVERIVFEEANKTIEEAIHVTTRLLNANILTRWYWKRRLKRIEERVDKTTDVCKQLLKMRYNARDKDTQGDPVDALDVRAMMDVSPTAAF